jgi:hypothetical protein
MHGEAAMSNLSLARIMYGSNEELRQGAGHSVPANIASFAPAAPAQPPATLSEVLRRIWLRFSVKH